MNRIIGSMLDNDLYKFTMGQAVFRHYDDVWATYKFINRGNTLFPSGFSQRLQEQIKLLARVRMTPDEKKFLHSHCYYLRPGYIDWLSNYQFDPREVSIAQNDGNLDITVKGPWYRAIYWEVVLMALVSQLYYQETNQPPNHNFAKRAEIKAIQLKASEVKISEFGTRRRHSLDVQTAVLAALKWQGKEASKGGILLGTSNVHLAHTQNLTAMGTFGHEWIMAHAGMFGTRMATRLALDVWAKEFGASLGIALADTYTTDVFLRDFGLLQAKLFDGVRQDSGDPYEFAKKMIDHYRYLRINPLQKTIVFSDGLDIAKAVAIAKFCKGRIGCTFGIGTHLTNDVGVTPLNIVVKLTSITPKGGRPVPVVKLSDSPGKETGVQQAISMAKFELGIN